ncbi:MAG: hypothetical protein KA712_06545 [Myxococcales bacterium]|nr:hypothetical protein [Myxococcales bacterium]
MAARASAAAFLPAQLLEALLGIVEPRCELPLLACQLLHVLSQLLEAALELGNQGRRVIELLVELVAFARACGQGLAGAVELGAELLLALCAGLLGARKLGFFGFVRARSDTSSGHQQ